MSKKEDNRIRERNRVLVPATVGIGGYVGLSLFFGVWLGWEVVIVSLLVLAGLFVLLQFETRTRFVYGFRQSDHHYRQIESLFALYAGLPIHRALPPMRGWAISPDMAALMISLVMRQKPKLILDVGSGVSSILLGYCVKELGEGRVIALEHEEPFAAATQRELEFHSLREHVEVVVAPIRQIPGQAYHWYDPEFLVSLARPIDFVVVDGPPEITGPLARYAVLPLVWEKLSPEAVIVVDDALSPEVAKTIALWIREFPEFTRTLVPTEKGTAVFSRGRVPLL